MNKSNLNNLDFAIYREEWCLCIVRMFWEVGNDLNMCAVTDDFSILYII